jgi:hypothetical protein
MAAAGGDNHARLQDLKRRRNEVETVVNRCMYNPEIANVGEVVEYAFSRDGITFMGGIEAFEGVVVRATDDDWNRVLSEGLATTFTVEWSIPKYPKDDLRVLHHGESLFYNLRGAGLFPDWNGKSEGEFTITAVDKTGVRLALAMALHPRLGANSRVSLVSSLTLSQ